MKKCKNCKVGFEPIRFNQKYCLDEPCIKVWVNSQKEKDWKFIYLSEDPTTVTQGYTMGFHGTSHGAQNCFIGREQSGRHMQTDTFNKYIGLCSQNKTKLSYNEWQKL